jgi:hypothetical protein
LQLCESPHCAMLATHRLDKLRLCQHHHSELKHRGRAADIYCHGKKAKVYAWGWDYICAGCGAIVKVVTRR